MKQILSVWSCSRQHQLLLNSRGKLPRPRAALRRLSLRDGKCLANGCRRTRRNGRGANFFQPAIAAEQHATVWRFAPGVVESQMRQ